MIDSGSLMNCPVTRESVKHSITIWGPSVASMKGRNTRSAPDAVKVDSSTITSVPPHIATHHIRVSIGIDVMKVNKIPFLVSISGNIS